MGTLLIAGVIGLAPDAFAVKTSFWKSNDIDAFLAGENVSGVAIESDGYLTLGPAWDSVATQLEGVSYIWCAARDSKGRIYFGTGDEGRIYRWTRGGGVSMLWSTGAPEITCITVDASDNVYAGSAPGGTIFRVGAKGDTTRYFDTGEESIWSLLVGKDGALYAGTGSKGRIYRVTAAGKGTVYAETKDVNVLSLALAKDGALLAGTASKGLLFRVEREGSPRVIYDGGGDEIRAIAVLDDGSIAVAVNRGRTSRPAGDSPADRGTGGGGSGESRYAVEVTARGGGKCGVFLVQPDGSARLLYAPPTDYAYAMIPNDAKSVLVATGESAALFRVNVDGTYALLGVPEQKQVLALVRGGGETFAATGNDAILYSLGSKPAKEGTFTSEANDMRSVSSFGRATVAFSGGEVLWSSRSGMNEEPDDGWSPWSSEVAVRGSVPVTSPPARFLQYRLRLRGAAPVVTSVEVAYLQLNLPPLLGNIQTYGPDNPFMEGGPEYRPPQISQTYPNGLKVEFSYPRVGPKQVSDASAAWARGIRSVSWDAADPNGDAMKFVVYVKAEDEKEWRKLVDDYSDRIYSWDSESFPNGEYRLKVTASDSPDNPPPLALSTARVGPVFQIDNVPPRVEGLQTAATPAPRGGRPGVTVTGTAIDADTRIGEIEYAVDWGDWKSVLPLDNIFDSREEKFRFEVLDLAPGEHSISIRASDADRNVAAAKVIAVGH